MRNFKFRAWDKSAEYFKSIEDDGDYYFRDDGEGIRLYDKWGECKNIILMQNTDLKDKNGIEIYEGDIVQDLYYLQKANGNKEIEDSGIGIITWIPCGFAIHYKGINIFNLEYIDDKDKLEVIGNIYETPELINTK